MKLFLHILAVVALAIFASGYVQKEAQAEYENYQPIPYEFNYEVHDAKTGDQKSHHENREGDVVKGYYSLREADGTLREVHYTADKINGFNAVVKKTGTPVYPKEPIQKGERNYDYVQNVHQSPHFY